ncbi:branched-chain amino acid ABC transporter permease [Rhizobium sp. FKL33]|uniref:branched-chain amino acid ABC transporter permease n=1 Tax=Rhizobium sp. FKL33 TaxID=2562307 RepID=UPI0010C0E38C|nr:branched-chain amino acid ABC transporter permease [Rhizobium sp. FKL33]
MTLTFKKNAVLLAVTLAILFLLQFVLPEYNILTATRMMVLAIFAVGFNTLLGYLGLMSLGHALFFAAGLYGAGLSSYHLGSGVATSFALGVIASAVVAVVIGMITLRTIRVSFMIVTLMFAQVGYLMSLYFTGYTNGQEGLSLPQSARAMAIGPWALDLSSALTRYNIAFVMLAITLAALFVYLSSRRGRVIMAIRENEERTEMLGFNVLAVKLEVFVISGLIAGGAGALYALLFGYVGSTFASFQYSIEALLFTLLGGAGTLLGPLVGVVLMVTMIDKLSELMSAYLMVIGVVLIALILWFPKGILGTIRERVAPWML